MSSPVAKSTVLVISPVAVVDVTVSLRGAVPKATVDPIQCVMRSVVCHGYLSCICPAGRGGLTVEPETERSSVRNQRSCWPSCSSPWQASVGSASMTNCLAGSGGNGRGLLQNHLQGRPIRPLLEQPVEQGVRAEPGRAHAEAGETDDIADAAGTGRSPAER